MAEQHMAKGCKALLALLIGCLLLAYLPGRAVAAPRALPALEQAGPSQYTVGDCSRVDKGQVRDEIEAHVLAVVNSGGASGAPGVIDRLVERKWAELDMDAAVDTAVQQAVDNLGAQEAYWDKLVSGWWGEKAQEYAERIANDAFSSPAFQVKLEALSTAVGADVARQVESQFAAAASVALLCLKEYVGEQYSDDLFRAFERSVRLDTQQANISATSPTIAGAIEQHGLAIAGVGTILVTQLVYRLAQKLTEKIAQRVAGKVVGRVVGKAGSSFIPVAGWVIGVALIAYDLWEGNQGALPQIQEALQSQEVKAKIREEIAAAVKDDLPDQAALIALETSVSLVEQWQGFCSRYGDVCQVADQNTDFRSLLSFVTLDELDRLAKLVDWYINQEGRRALDAAVADGALERLLALPDATAAALLTSMSPSEAIGWLDTAGDRIDRVLSSGIYRLAQPDEFDAYSVAALLAVSNPADLQKLLTLAPVQRNVLLALPADTLQALTAAGSAAQLALLANRMLEPAQSPTQAAQLAEEVVQGKVSIEQMTQSTGPFLDHSPDQLSSQSTGQPAVAAAGGPAAAASPTERQSAGQSAAGLQRRGGDDNILFPAILAALGILVAVAAVAIGYRHRQRRTIRSE